MGPRRHTEAWTVWPFKPRKSQPHIFSPFLWTPVLFLFLGPGASGEDSAQRLKVAGTPGGSATFHLNISVDTQIENVVWNGPHGSLCLASSKGDVNFMDKSYKGRIKILRPSYSLSLYNLTLKDAGSYKAQINRDDSTVTTYEEFTLGVYEQLQKPQVTPKSVAVSENASCTVTLICSVQEEGKDIDYSWAPEGHNDSESSVSSTLTISWVPCGQDLHRSYTCTARNPVSKRSSDPVFARQFCTDVRGPVKETVGLLGESISLRLSLPASQDIKRVLWIFNTSVISTWEEIPTVEPVTQSKVPDKNEVSVSDQDHSLEIKQLRMENAGRYHAYVCSTDSRVTSTTHVTLFVYGKLEKPKVTHSQTISENGSCTVQLACSVEDNAPNVKYRWTSSLQKGTVHEGSNFNASWRLGENHPILNCTASNPVSNSSQMFVSGDICPGPGTSRELLIVLPVMAAIFICIGILGWCTWRQKKKCSSSVSALNQERTSAVPSAYENMDIPSMATGYQQMPPTVSTSFSDSTSDEDEERREMQLSVHGKDEACVQFTSEDSALHSASERKAEYHLVIPGGTAPASVVNGGTLYAHLLHNSKGMDPIPQKDDNSATIYSSVQRSQKN